MPLRAADLQRVRDVEEQLFTWQPDAPARVDDVCARVASLFDGDYVYAFGLHERRALAFSGFSSPELEEMLVEYRRLLHDPQPWGSLDMLRPPADEANRPWRQSEITQRHASQGEMPVLTRFFSPRRITDGYRVLLCRNGALLANLGVHYVGGDASERDGEVLEALVPALRHFFAAHEVLATRALGWASFFAALEEMPRAAWLLDDAGHVRAANSAGRATIDDASRDLRARLASAIEVGDPDYSTTKVIAPGVRPHVLVVARPVERDAVRAQTWAARWALTPRQTEVLELLARGLSNKEIAASLGCSHRTIEVHVSALLARAQVGSRSELIARVRA